MTRTEEARVQILSPPRNHLGKGRLVVPGRQDRSIWLTIAIGIVAALIGSPIASALGVGETRRIDWIKLIQVALAAAGGGPGRRPLCI
jgi:hypothetical protein